ncbi:hypothetical protein AVEN_99103-1 [Araneus ventricosus]|uniref:Uncharacterized protein n=1 Tax=Araneus ventricosus TaxID=182803 RepID=A0A4Y2VM18_ARAVE|nr:hypothetical protein AVEN_99103-1 [Araneus ventricosus]
MALCATEMRDCCGPCVEDPLLSSHHSVSSKINGKIPKNSERKPVPHSKGRLVMQQSLTENTFTILVCEESSSRTCPAYGIVEAELQFVLHI